MQLTDSADVVGNVRAELARRKISHRTAAVQLDLTQSALSRRLRGDVEFSTSELRAVATLLGVPVAALLGEVPA